jgi:streptogramin lyase
MNPVSQSADRATEPINRPTSSRRRAFTLFLAAATLSLALVTATTGVSGAAGSVTNYSDPTISFGFGEFSGIASGPDGALWFTNLGNNSIGRITTAGAFTNLWVPKMPSKGLTLPVRIRG